MRSSVDLLFSSIEHKTQLFAALPNKQQLCWNMPKVQPKAVVQSNKQTYNCAWTIIQSFTSFHMWMFIPDIADFLNSFVDSFFSW